jgi:hypothetical protein
MNKKDEALSALKTSFEKGNNNFKHISIDDDLDNIKQTPEYISLYSKWFEKFKVDNNFTNTE